MPIAPHASTPAVATGDGSITTTAFSPPAGSLLVAVLMAGASSPSISNSGTARTWTLRKQHASTAGVRIYTAPNPTALTNTTVTVTSATGGLKIYVITGQHPSNPIGANGSGSTTTNNANVAAYTSTGNGSRGIVGALDLASLGQPTSTDDESAWTMSGESSFYGLAAIKAANTPTAGTGVTFNLDAAGTSAADWAWVALEILAGSEDASANLSVVEVASGVSAPSVSAGASAEAATVAASTTVPAPGVSAGASATPATVAVAASVPAPSVTTDNAVIVSLATVAAAASTPAPAVSASASAAPATVAAAASVWLPDVDAEFNADVTLPHVAVAVAVPAPLIVVPVLPGDQLDGLPGQLEWNGFVLGRGTPYRITGGLDGFRGKETPDSGHAPKANDHGSSPGRPLARDRQVVLTGHIRAPRAQVEEIVLALENATPLLEDATQWPLVVNDLGTPYLMRARIGRVHIPVDRLLRLGWGKIAVEWLLADPRRYNINSTGVTVPIDTIVDVTNAGNAATKPLLRIPGPVETPKIHNLTLNRVLEFNLTLDDGEELEIDTDLERARVGSTNVISSRSSGSVSVPDWILARGPQEIEYTAASGGTQAEVLYRDAWN
ncbi:hypothetical protein [Nonomuraea sp. NPDC050310]|uniref:hypothetical protein n=1 Tax=Nonomuraea sp. NPDC050310 TaxID=3154935 RepID=UPI00340E3856